LGAIGAIDLIGKHGGATHDIGEGGNDTADCIGQEDVGVLAGVDGQFANASPFLLHTDESILHSFYHCISLPLFHKITT